MFPSGDFGDTRGDDGVMLEVLALACDLGSFAGASAASLCAFDFSRSAAVSADIAYTLGGFSRTRYFL